MKCYMLCTIDYDVSTLHNGSTCSVRSQLAMLELVRVSRYQRISSSILTDNLSISTSSGGKLNSCINVWNSVNISEPIHRYGQIIRWYRQILV